MKIYSVKYSEIECDSDSLGAVYYKQIWLPDKNAVEKEILTIKRKNKKAYITVKEYIINLSKKDIIDFLNKLP